jgi:hypothetical protein
VNEQRPSKIFRNLNSRTGFVLGDENDGDRDEDENEDGRRKETRKA